MHLQEAQQRQAAQEAAKSGEEANDLEKAQDFGRLRTMQVMQARVTGENTSKHPSAGQQRLLSCGVPGTLSPVVSRRFVVRPGCTACAGMIGRDIGILACIIMTAVR